MYVTSSLYCAIPNTETQKFGSNNYRKPASMPWLQVPCVSGRCAAPSSGLSGPARTERIKGSFFGVEVHDMYEFHMTDVGTTGGFVDCRLFRPLMCEFRKFWLLLGTSSHRGTPCQIRPGLEDVSNPQEFSGDSHDCFDDLCCSSS